VGLQEQAIMGTFLQAKPLQNLELIESQTCGPAKVSVWLLVLTAVTSELQLSRVSTQPAVAATSQWSGGSA
jgi:hypothetical protein